MLMQAWTQFPRLRLGGAGATMLQNTPADKFLKYVDFHVTQFS